MASKKRLSGAASGKVIKLRYLGDSKEILEFEGVITREAYKVGGHINIVGADTTDLSTGESWAPGLLQLKDEKGADLFEIHVPLKEELEAEKAAEARVQEALDAAEVLAVEPELESEPDDDEVPDAENSVSGD